MFLLITNCCFFYCLGNIIIERWIPYGPPPERQTIVQRAPPAIKYAESHNQIVVYENVEAQIVRRFEKLGVEKENPAAYAARYGDSLLDSATLLQQARHVGVHEDLVKVSFQKL